MDVNNPAVTKHTNLSPADLEKIGKDPSLLTFTARKMLAIQMMTTHDRMKDVNIPLGQRQSWMEFLSRVGDVVPRQSAGGVGVLGPGFSVQIVMNAPSSGPATTATFTTPALLNEQTSDITDVTPVSPPTESPS